MQSMIILFGFYPTQIWITLYFDAILIDNPSKSINHGKDSERKCHTCIKYIYYFVHQDSDGKNKRDKD